MADALNALDAISPLDGRYARHTQGLAQHFSERALIRRRIAVELAWLETILPLLAPQLINDSVRQKLAEINTAAAADDAAVAVKALEAQTNHDIKAVEYWIGEQLRARQLEALCPYVHFACTSWDINNVALALDVHAAVHGCLLPVLNDILARLRAHASAHADTPMLARTHGQPASPTTLGKEFANFYVRLAPRQARLAAVRLPAKFSGAVGNYNAHTAAAAHIDWAQVTRDFVTQHELAFASCTTQIEPYDDLAELFDLLRRINTILLDCCRDCWGYISLDYFIQQTGGGAEAGSSTMPHKVNPIEFENAEGNLGVANALFTHFADKLPVSRWQRDLSDSTVLRAVGSGFAHTLLAWKSAHAGLGKITVNRTKLAADLENNWVVLTEAVQTVLRLKGVSGAYEQLKDLSRGQVLDQATLHAFIRQLALDEETKAELLALTPATYCGLAAQLCAQHLADAEPTP